MFGREPVHIMWYGYTRLFDLVLRKKIYALTSHSLRQYKFHTSSRPITEVKRFRAGFAVG